jgi:hypothetical protein
LIEAEKRGPDMRSGPGSVLNEFSIDFIDLLPESPEQSLEEWAKVDLAKSGLTPETFPIELSPGGDFEGYKILYPNAPGFNRLKLRQPKEGGPKYLSAKGSGNRPYLSLPVQKELENESSTEPIFIVEGEKKAAKATLDGFSTIGLTGVDGWRDKRSGQSEFLPELETLHWKGRKVYIVYDSDRADNHKVLRAERALAIELIRRGAEVFIVSLPGEVDGKKNGLDDYLKRHGRENFRRLVAHARPAHKVHDIQEYDLAGAAPEVAFEVEYPAPLNDAAFYGLAGEIVKAIEPNSEADPAALLPSLLAGFGNVVGDGAYVVVGRERHHLRLFVTLVGNSSKGRKGTSWSPIRSMLEAVDPGWTEGRVLSGLSSGEGVIYHLRDPIYKTEVDKKTGAVNEVLADAGESDKRLFILEGEFAQPLRLLRREGNILSPILRNAWDSGDLRTLTKNNPLKASGAHLSIIGHITKQELVRCLTEVETGNGFANRFLWFCVRRSKVLPFGGDFNSDVFEPLEDRLREAVDFAKGAGEITWAKDTRPLWESVYPDLSDGKPGLIGDITNRAEAQVTRLACTYALLDKSAEIEPEHLRAALAVWQYCEASVRYIFQGTATDPLANKILKILSSYPKGVGRREISNRLGRNYSADRITEALETLKTLGYAESKAINTGGRPAEVWFLVKNGNE